MVRRFVEAACLLGLLAQTSCSTHESAAFKSILIGQTASYPGMEVQDLYKFIHQAALGPAHAVLDTAAAQAWLTREVASLKPIAYDEPLWEQLRPDGALVRLNLRPAIAQGLDLDRVLRSFIQTSQTYEGSLLQLEQYWAYARELARFDQIPFTVSVLDSIFTEQAINGHPAIHHSDAYTRAYAPAYRVVDPTLVERQR